MTTVLGFENVSKGYRLGLTRTSLPAVLTRLIRDSLGAKYKSPQDKRFFWALKNVDFELSEGESLGLIGPNGAGKSTILKLLARITEPTFGRIDVKGRLSALIELGAGFHPDLTGRDNIFLNGAILGLKRREVERHFDEIVAFSEVEDFIDTPLKRYSSGMAVRLGFAVASCIEPEILLVDEVLAVGDASFRQKCVERIKDLIKGGTSLIFVSHDLALVKSVCESSMYLDRGKVECHGTTSEVIDFYNRALDEGRARKLSQRPSLSPECGLDVEIAKIEVVAGGDQLSGDFLGDRPAEVRVRYVAYKSIGDANILVRIYRADGISCCVMRTSLDQFRVSLERGRGVVSVALDPLQLFGGTYFAVAWVMDAADARGLARGSSDFFTVTNRVPGLDAQDGVFEPNRRWNHTVRPFDNRVKSRDLQPMSNEINNRD